MELKQILYFVRVAEQRSFSRAAELLDVSQPSLSRQVQALERTLGHHLLVRNGRGVEPTEAGARFLTHGRALLELADRAREDLVGLSDQPTGKVVVGLPPRIALVITPALVRLFRERFPQARITVAEGLSAQMREALLSGRIELALLYDPPPSPQLVYESLYREHLVLVAAPEFDPHLPEEVPVAALGRFPLIVPSLPNAIRTLVERTCRQHGVRVVATTEVDAVHTILELAMQGQGYAILPRSAVAGLQAAGKLSCARIVSPPIRNDLVLATHRSRGGTRLSEGTAGLLRRLDLAKLLEI